MKNIIFKELNTLQKNYTKNTSDEILKAKGQFFTPTVISTWMSEWVMKIKPKTILDPSIGFGSLIYNFYGDRSIRITGVEKDKNIFTQIKKKLKVNVNIQNKDFLIFKSKDKFDGIIANPPYIRFQKREVGKKIFEKFEKIIGKKISKLSNIYVLFIIQIINFLKDNSRASIIVPNEWMNANFGDALKVYLKETNVLSKIVYISHESLVFDNGNLSTSCILLLEKNRKIKKSSVDFIYVKNFEKFFKTSPNSTTKDSNHWLNFNYEWKHILKIKKWDSLFIKKKVFLKKKITIKNLGTSKRGIATGSNKFFLRNHEFIKSRSLDSKNFKPCIGKTALVNGTIFSKGDFSNLKENNKNVFLFDPIKINKSEKKFISEGESLRINKLYLPSHRKVWFNNEKRSVSKIWVPVFSRERVKFIFNETNCISLTCFHSLEINLDKEKQKCLVSLLNLDDMQESILSQKRVYGGGLIKFEPKDILDIELPDIRKFKESSIKKLAKELMYQDYCFRKRITYKSKIKINELS